MNETKRMLALFGGIIVIVAIICIIAFWPEKDTTFTCDVKADEDYAKVGKLSYENFECLKEEDEYLIAVALTNITKASKETLNTAIGGTGKGIYVVSLEDYTKEQAKKLKDELEYKDDSFENDVLIYIKDGKVESYKENILTDETVVRDFLKENGLTKFMCDAKATEDYENLAEFDYNTFECLYEQEDPFVMVLAQTTCSYCQQYAPVLNDFAIENNKVAYIINIDQLTEEEMTNLTESFSYFETNTSWGTPLTIAVDDKEVVGDLSGYTDQADTIKDVYVKAGIME